MLRLLEDDYASFYDKRYTDESMKELHRFCDWLDKTHGYRPVIIGGWAVYAHNPAGPGSRDIDIVMSNEYLKNQTINEYIVRSGYKKDRFEATWSKPVLVGDQEFKIYLDVCTEQDPNHPEPGMAPELQVPWRLARQYAVEKQIEDTNIRVPCPEVLLMYKAKAYASRANTRASEDPRYVRAKIWKDALDVMSLVRHTNIDKVFLNNMVAEYSIPGSIKSALSEIAERKDIIESVVGKDNNTEATKLKRTINNLVSDKK